MASALDLSIVLRLADQVSGPARAIQAITDRMARGIRETQSAMRDMNRQAQQVQGLQTMEQRMSQSAARIAALQQRIQGLQTRLAASGGGAGSAALQQQIASAQARLQGLQSTHQNMNRTMQAVRESLRAAGVDTSNLAQAEAELRRRLQEANGQLQNQQDRLGRVTAAMDRLGGAWNRAKGLFTLGAGAGVGLGALTGQFIQTAAQTESYVAILKVLEGTEEKAKKAMDWVNQFATTTPYEVNQVMDAFVKLRAYGMDPTNGLLLTLGDTAAAMGKDVIQAVEAIADAVTGENERLKEFGIKGSVIKGTKWMTYSYTDKEGVQKMVKVDKNDRKQIENALRKIWSEKYSGSMDERSKTMMGIISNLKDQWGRFQGMVMDSGPFQRIKGHLQDLLDRVNAMTDSGELKQWAEVIGAKMMQVLDVSKQVGAGFWFVAQKVYAMADQVQQFLGGWDRLVIGLMAFKVVGVIAALGALGTSLASLATLAMAHPIIALVGTIAVVGTLIAANWQAVKAAIDPVLVQLEAAAARMKPAWDGLVAWLTGLAQHLGAGYERVVMAVSMAMDKVAQAMRMGAEKIKALWNELAAWFGGLVGQFTNLGTNIIQGLGRGIDAAWGAVKAKVQAMVDWLPDVVKEQLGIQSPSVVFAGFGQNLMVGLANGITDGSGRVLGNVQGLTNRIRQAGSALTLGGAMAMTPLGAHAALKAPTAPMGPGAGGGSTVTVHQTINAAPGMDEKRLADEVRRRFEEHQRTQQSRAHSRLYDYR